MMLLPTNEILPKSMRLTSGSQITIRHLNENDFFKGFLNLLNQLSPSRKNRDVNHTEFVEFMKQMQRSKIIIVAECWRTHEIIATVSLFIEGKFLHNLSFVGHIEDLVIHSEYRHQKIGQTLIHLCLHYCFHGINDEYVKYSPMICYKVLLSCQHENERFYQKCGFHLDESQMRINKDKWSDFATM